MNISIFGLGYVGCVSLGCLAQNGHNVIGVDTNKTKIDFVNKGKSPIVENEIDRIIAEQYSFGKISATDDGIGAVKNTDVSIICVGTPSTTNGHLDLGSILKVSEEIAKGIKEKDLFHIVVIRSTVYPGTNEKVTRIVEETSGKTRNEDFAVVSNPEFLREGTAVRDYYEPPFTLIGSTNTHAVETMKELYKNIMSPVIVTDIKVAEMIKYVNNAFHALKITFANEIGKICKKLQIDPVQLMEVFCKDKKLNLSEYYLKPGFAYGGSCLPKDLKALRTIAHDNYVDCPVLESIERSNELQKDLVFQRIIELDKKNVGFLGLSFKSGTDDLRESPIVDIIERLLGKGYNILIYDKNVRLSQLVGGNKEYIMKKIPYISRFITDNQREIIDKSDILVIVNNDKNFREILEKIDKDITIYDLVNFNFEKKKQTNYEGIAW